MKKITLIILVIIIFNYITSSFYYVNADNFTDIQFNQNSWNTFMESGNTTVTANGELQNVEIENKESTTKSTANIILGVANIIPTMITLLMTLVTCSQDITNITWFSIQKLVLGEFELFDINYFSDTTSSSVTVESNANNKMKESISKWFYIIRSLALALSILVLIFTGIKMAITTVAEEKAKTKIILANWFIGFAIIFILPYIMFICIEVSNKLIEMMSSLIKTELSLLRKYNK